MFLPIKVYSDEKSYFRIKICIPYFLKFKGGVRIKYSSESNEIYGFVGTKKDCLHIYYYMFIFRIRSNKILEKLKDTNRYKFWNGFSLEQVFARGII